MNSNVTTSLLIAVYLGITAYAILALPIHTHAGAALAALGLPR